MKETLKKFGSLNLGKELSKNELKEITGGGLCQGKTCGNGMACTGSPINLGYCQQVWHSSTISSCTYQCNNT